MSVAPGAAPIKFLSMMRTVLIVLNIRSIVSYLISVNVNLRLILPYVGDARIIFQFPRLPSIAAL
jgi:hypothetical protein